MRRFKDARTIALSSAGPKLGQKAATGKVIAPACKIKQDSKVAVRAAGKTP